jgi:uncharacterized damage-inducible protein DinB
VNPIFDIWNFTRLRLDPAYRDLTEEQLLWRPHAAAHNIGELVYHMAGCEHYWAARMSDRDPRANAWEEKLDIAVRDGFLIDGTSSPFTPEEMKLPLLEEALEFTGQELTPILQAPTKKQLEMRLISPLGPEVSGYEGFLRIVQHAGYHTGQIWIYRMDPRFPKS